MAGKATGTAAGPMTTAAVERHFPAGRRLTDDELAARMRPAGMRAAARPARWAPLRIG
ncbi:hypothetical protein G3I59_18130 [Amycolatopsis rubida]|uniref:Uncharacterized protein n=1 Tax=Amycolatopsis rubida TaxID=112413 RepID=A0A1I5UT46_9PSEU|nr:MULTISPECIES: hypothetical protein [Amycolatopsis]MYW92475.1 hypothetical protein [Amycolatopsis rubida]NEC57463.1 hypothetical protein [Amycolatopsis rubida]OAP26965.1 hypothetical protein A4R44_02953 [Amycolatopsis sp. M39]SFP98372.1 hypothetical protein SAMN05421854_10882 [Amycolatopsis rubida]